MNWQRRQTDKQVFQVYLCAEECDFSSIPLKHKHVDAVIEGVNPIHCIASNRDVYRNK